MDLPMNENIPSSGGVEGEDNSTSSILPSNSSPTLVTIPQTGLDEDQCMSVEGEDCESQDDDDEEEYDEDEEITVQDILKNFLDLKSSLETSEIKLLSMPVPLDLLYQVKASLASLNGNLEDLQYDLDGLVLVNDEDKAIKKQILEDLLPLFDRISFLDDRCCELLKEEAERLKKEGNAHFKEGQNEKAIESYTAAIRIDSTVPQYFTNRALAHQKNANHNKAIEDAKIAIRLDVNYLKAYIILLKSSLALRQYPTLLEIFNSLPNEFTDRPEVIELHELAASSAKDLGNAAFKQGNTTDAIEHYTTAIDFHPTNHILYSNRSAAYQSKGMWKEALKDGERCIQHNELFPKGYIHIARSQVQLQRWSDAEITINLAKTVFEADHPAEYALISTQCQEIISLIESKKGTKSSATSASSVSNSAKAEQFKQIGNKHYKEEDYSEAIRYYSQAISLCPQEPSYYGNRSAAWLMMKEFKRAITDCVEGLKFEKVIGQLDKLRLRHAAALASMGSIQQAIAILEEAIGLPERESSESMKALSDQIIKLREVKSSLQLAKESLEKGEYSRAKRLFQITQSILSDDPSVFIGIAKACFELGEYEDSSRAAQKVIACNFGDGHDRIEAYLVRSNALQAMGCTDLAQKHLLAALQLDPDNSNLQMKLKSLRRLISEVTRLRQTIDAAMNHRKYEEAISSCHEGMQLEGITKKFLSEFHERRSKAYSMKAKLVLRTSVQTNEGDGTDNTQNDAQALWRRCLQDANSALYYDRTDSTLTALFLKCEALQGLGRYEEALEELKSAYESGPSKGNETIREKHKEAQFLLKKSKRVDYYKLLGCPRGELSSEKEIRMAYKKSALKWHPDRHSSADEQTKLEVEKKFKEISDAHELLLDPQRKALYDQGYDREEIEQRMEMQNQQQQQQQHFGGGGRRR
jgi:DnaJ homolog subfamily C member 7